MYPRAFLSVSKRFSSYDQTFYYGIMQFFATAQNVLHYIPSSSIYDIHCGSCFSNLDQLITFSVQLIFFIGFEHRILKALRDLFPVSLITHVSQLYKATFRTNVTFVLLCAFFRAQNSFLLDENTFGLPVRYFISCVFLPFAVTEIPKYLKLETLAINRFPE